MLQSLIRDYSHTLLKAEEAWIERCMLIHKVTKEELSSCEIADFHGQFWPEQQVKFFIHGVEALGVFESGLGPDFNYWWTAHTSVPSNRQGYIEPYLSEKRKEAAKERMSAHNPFHSDFLLGN